MIFYHRLSVEFLFPSGIRRAGQKSVAALRSAISREARTLLNGAGLLIVAAQRASSLSPAGLQFQLFCRSLVTPSLDDAGFRNPHRRRLDESRQVRISSIDAAADGGVQSLCSFTDH